MTDTEITQPSQLRATPWKTGIAKVEDSRIIVRGHDLSSLIGKLPFSGMLLLIFRGTVPTVDEIAMVDAILVSVADHGISPSTTITRYLASTGVPIQAAVAGGVLSFGNIHGGAGEQFARILSEQLRTASDATTEDISTIATNVVEEYRSNGQPLPGYGHPQHPSGDPRVPLLLEIAEATGVKGRHLELAAAVEDALARAVGRRIPMNIDGVVAACVLDLGVDWRLTRSFLFVPRTAGLAAHVIEEWDREPGWRHVPEIDITYDGPIP